MKEVIKIENLIVNYYNTQALKDINLKIYENDFVGVIGPNGGGKSTLIKVIAGLMEISSGELVVNEKDMAYVPQFSSIDRTFPISVFDMILTGSLKKGLHPFHKYSEDDKKYTKQIIERLGLSEVAEKQINELSGGQFERLLLARALVSRPSLLILDEPTASVDSDSKDIIYEVLNELSAEMTIIMVAHDFDLKTIRINRLVLLDRVMLGDRKI